MVICERSVRFMYGSPLLTTRPTSVIGMPGLTVLRAPAELLDQLLRATELRRPAGGLPAVVDVEDDERVRVHHDELHNGAFQRDRLFVVAPCITVMRPAEAGNQARRPGQPRTGDSSSWRRHLSKGRKARRT